ncbi:MAG TPA: hypothetical protein VKB47_14685 [Terracidiphilus sp.]|nr:hypothetical protein [Terracidiphilus sp.]
MAGGSKHPIGRSLHYAILFTVAASVLVGVGLDQLINQILNANAGGTGVWTSVLVLPVYLTVRSASHLRALARSRR